MADKKPKKVIRAYQENLVFFLGETFVWRYGVDGIFGNETVEATNAMNRALNFPEGPFPTEGLVRWMNMQVGAPKDVPFNKLRKAIIQQMKEAGEQPPAIEPAPAEPETPDLYSPPVKKGWPWWVWALIGLGAVGAVSGGVYLYYKYGRRRRSKVYGDYSDTSGCDYAGLSETDNTDSAEQLPARSITWGE